MYSQYLRINAHVADTNLQMIRKAWHMLDDSQKYNRNVRARRHSWLRTMITYHEKAKGLAVGTYY